jgi:hypothetical protein
VKIIFKKIIKTTLILLGVGVVFYIGWIILLISAFGGFDKDYSITDLKENFEKNKTGIYELKSYYNEIAPKNRFVDIEFKNDNTILRFGIKALDSTAGNVNEPMFIVRNLKISTSKMDSIINPMGWTRETLKILKEKLDNADCIQIANGVPTKIGYKRCGMGMYSFNVFDTPIPGNLKTYYNDSCTYIYVNERLVLEYAGGAMGSQCFYNLK